MHRTTTAATAKLFAHHGYAVCINYKSNTKAANHVTQERSGSPHEYIDYAASKGAIDTLTKELSLEVAAEGIRVNCVRPGFIYTDMHADGGEPERIERLKSVIPLQRGGLPEEVAEAIYWLACEKSSFSTGNYLDLTGGL
ncbi:SDR family oxidoreductase [Vibrio ruber]|uniref:SDR family oxidoreductase n=1 Tax=Vibrio ruber TaxID=184755 RepID=UPI0009865B02|nr:SDR family oxidoreductase [Vibrio ruber]